MPLAEVFDEHLLAWQAIDFLTVDVEGMDVEVLESNDWKLFRPHVAAVEDLDVRLEDPSSSATFRLLSSHGYRFVSHAVKTSFYIDES